MNIFQLRNAGDYGKVVAAVLVGGRPRSPRSQPTLDIGLTTLAVDNPHGGLPIGLGRGLNSAIAAVEALQLIAGVARPDLMLEVAPQFEAYTNRDARGRVYFHGAYGERVGFQVLAAVDKLKKDPDTRQAVITLWDPHRDNLPDARDYPCTLSLTFSVQGGALELDIVMRSNDVWLGLPYDLFQFTQLQLTVANSLSLRVGQYRHTVLSMHMYERDRDVVNTFLSRAHTRSYEEKFQPNGVGTHQASFQQTMHRALQIMDGSPPSNMTRSETWYWTAIKEARHRVQTKLG